MKADPGHIASAATSRTARPCAKLEIYWDNAWVDETSYLQLGARCSSSLGEPGLMDLGNSGSQLTVALDNRTGRFSVTQSGSPAQTYGIFNKRIRFWAGYYYGGTPELVLLFTGRIVSVEESEVPPIARLQCAGEESVVMQQKVATGMFYGLTTDQWIATVATAAGVSSYDLERGCCTIPWIFADDDPAWDEIVAAARGEAGVAFFDHQATLRFWAVTHWCNASSVATYNQDDYETMEPQIDYSNVANIVSCEYQPRQTAQTAVLYSLSEPLYLGPGEYRTETIRLRVPAASGVSYVYRAAAGGADATTYVSLVETARTAMTCTLSLQNSDTARGVWLTQLDAIGVPLQGRPAAQVVVDESAGKVPRRRDYRGSAHVQTRAQAELLANMAVARLKNPRRIYKLSGMRANPLLELGDIVTVQGSRGVNATAIVVELDFTYSESFRMDIVAVDSSNLYAYTDYLKLGTGTVGTGRLFF